MWWSVGFIILDRLSYFEFPRCLFPKESEIARRELHTFCDASEEAYAAVVYICNVYRDGQVLVRHIKRSIMLAPTKKLSIPKLELNAAVLGANGVAKANKE